MPDLSGVSRTVDGALGHADRALRAFDAYRPVARSGIELIHRDLNPHVVGRGFEVGARRDVVPSREAARVLRDGRLIVVDPRRSSGAEEERDAGRTEHGRPVRPGEPLRPSETGRPSEAGGYGDSPELSLFEKIFLAHFEGGVPIASEALGKGEFRFLPKTEKGWAEFFQKFAAFALLKSVKAGDVQSLVIRGLIRPDGTLTKEARALLVQAKAVLVSDLKLMDGKTDKFARLAVSSDALVQTLSKMAPGETLTPEVFAELLKAMGGEEFSYLALSHKIVNPDMAKADPSAATQAYQSPEQMRETAVREGQREATLGIALSAKTERMVAERLDIDLRSSRSDIGVDRRAGEAGIIPASQMAGLLGKKKKRSSLWSASGGDEGYDSSVFVPWYQHVFKPQKFKGRPRWWVPFMYFLAGSAAVLAAYYAFRFWMQ